LGNVEKGAGLATHTLVNAGQPVVDAGVSGVDARMQAASSVKYA